MSTAFAMNPLANVRQISSSDPYSLAVNQSSRSIERLYFNRFEIVPASQVELIFV